MTRPADRSERCLDCDSAELSRRRFIAAASLGAAAAGLGALPRMSLAETPVVKPVGETLVAQLHHSLTDAQRRVLCFPFDHPLRRRVDNNWHIVKQPIGQALTPDQQDLVKQIFLSLHSDAYAAKVLQQVEHDNVDDGGFAGCAVALFGEPNADPSVASKFEFVFTGRHVTRRCDGNSVEGAAFGGPIFYGHAAQSFHEKPDHPGNIYWYQALAANDVFKSLDAKQRQLALRTDPRHERGNATVALRNRSELTGLPVAALAADQKQLVRKTLADLLAPFRLADAAEVLKLVDAGGGVDALHMTFYSNADLGHDGVWDVWQLESPTMIWFFRGAPHVHTWVHVRAPQA